MHKFFLLLMDKVSRRFVLFSVLIYFYEFVFRLIYGLGSTLEWKTTQCYINYYDFGFIKRGLVGTFCKPFLSLLGDNVLYVYFFILAIDVLLFFATLFFVKKGLESANFDRFLSVFLKLLFVMSPVGFIQFSYEAGRYDHFNYLLIAIIIFLINRDNYYVPCFLLVVSILVHEAALFYVVPSVFCILFYKIGDTNRNLGIFKRWLICIIFVLPCLLTALFVLIWGNIDVPSNFLPVFARRGLAVWTRGFIEVNFCLAPRHYIITFFYAVMPYLLLFHFYKVNNLPKDLFVVSCFMPLGLFLFGFDYARWTQIIFISVFIAVFYHASKGATKFDLKSNSMLSYLLYIYLLPLGPIGDITTFPYLTRMNAIFSFY